MEINADFEERALVHSTELDWVDSPVAGVQRRMLDRVGDEVARATTIVRYAPRSQFPPHVHTGGEEFLVLEGVFQDEHGDFPAGSYVRNPPESSHTPGSEKGCTIFVKLWQFDPADRTPVIADIDKLTETPDSSREGVSVSLLHRDHREEVRIERWAPGAEVTLDTSGGAELLVLEGGFVEGGDSFSRLSWLRVPRGGELIATAGRKGARIWVKTGGLRFVDPPLLD